MKILIVDRTTEAQAAAAAVINRIDPSDWDLLDLHIQLANPGNFQNRLRESDVLILGSALGEEAKGLAKTAKNYFPEIEIVMLVNSAHYCAGTFRAAHGTRVRKILSDSASELDLLQELVSINEEFRLKGKSRSGNLIVFCQAKGGLGVTNICAALGELCTDTGRETILWDMDTDSHDLSRSLNASAQHSESLVSAWISGEKPITRESFKAALIPLGDNVSLLPPPNELPAAMDLAGHSDMAEVVTRIIDLARNTHDNIIVDTAKKLSPATGALIRMADKVVVVIDDSVLGLSAVHPFVNSLQLLLPSTDSLYFLCSGTKTKKEEMAGHLEEAFSIKDGSWELPSIPSDPSAEKWPGTGKTLASIGTHATKKAFDEAALVLDLKAESTRTSNKDKGEKVVKLLGHKASAKQEEKAVAGGFARSLIGRMFNPVKA